MSLPEVTSAQDWLEARRSLLAREKESTRARDALNAERRRLPMVKVDKEYVFEGPAGRATLTDLFGGHRRAAAFVLASRAPQDKIAVVAKERDWFVPWYSTYGSDFNYDFQVTLDADRGLIQYNYSELPDAAGGERSTELPGVSCFLQADGEVFHTYSTFARGTDVLGSAYSFLDLTALGRQEDWEEPKGRTAAVRGGDPSFSS